MGNRSAVAATVAIASLALAGAAGSERTTFPGVNGRVVVQGTERGASQYAPSNLYVFNTEANGYFVQLTRGKAFDANPEWSPDGKRIAFDSNRGTSSPDDHDIFVVNQDGSGLKRLTSGKSNDQAPTWSPDGTKLAFFSNRSGNDDIWVMNGSGGGLTQLTTVAQTDWDPEWSPDGSKIAFGRYHQGEEDIWVMNADGSGQHNLGGGVWDAYNPVWVKWQR